MNVHFSLLPRWRGAAPVERAILAGDTETGVCIMRLEAELDTGPVYARATTSIGDDQTAGDVSAVLVPLGADLLVATLPEIRTREPEPQRGEPTYAEKLTVEEFELRWDRPVDELVRVVRAGNPRPGAWTTVGGTRVKVWRARRRRRCLHPDRGATRGKASHAGGRVDARPARASTSLGHMSRRA